MDVVERLTLEAAQADTMLACEHRQRYGFAAGLSAGARVLDLCCGSGYGGRILATRADSVVGVDNDLPTIEAARATLAPPQPNLSFEAADALAYLSRRLDQRFDAIVCFEGLEHLRDLDRALSLLRGHAEGGMRLIASVPNGKLFEEENPFHVTEFGYDEALAAFADFPAAVMVPQFLAEGSVICPAGAEEAEISFTVQERDEPEYANHFIFCVNFAEADVQRVHHGRMQLESSPVFNRWSEDLKRGAWALRRENARLARARLGKGGSAAAAALAGVADREAQIASLQTRCAVAETRVSELERRLISALGTPDGGGTEPGEGIGEAGSGPSTAHAGAVQVLNGSPDPLSADDDPNSWEERRRRAATVLVPWIEQTVPLAGKTVLEYGCGNAAVSCAVAARAGRVIGLDIDRKWIDQGNAEISARGLRNVELQLHPVETILDAAARYRGEVDVFLLYAVLEHLTLAERLDVLRLAREVVAPEGAIVVCETPNRLIYFDHHTAQMPFFHLLPDELAAEYYSRSEREDFTRSIEAAGQEGREARLEAIVRWGRGVSFHEFELVFGDLTRHVLASSYDPLLFPERPIHPDEVILARYLDRVRPDLAPVWSRYWLDLILSPRPVELRAPFLRPWSADTAASAGVSWTRWENMHLHGPESNLGVDLPHPTRRLVVGSVSDDGAPLRLYARASGAGTVLTAEIDTPAHHTAFTTFTLAEPAQEISLAASRACYLVFVGYDD